MRTRKPTPSLQLRHSITAGSTTDYSISTQQAVVQTTSKVNNTLTTLLIGIAALSLLVGGIGVMNIMLVSVRERTREIGLRKALGGTPSMIRRQFLSEASMLGLAGGLLGVVVGIVGAVVLPHLTATRVIVSPEASVLAITSPSASAWRSGSTPRPAPPDSPPSTPSEANETALEQSHVRSARPGLPTVLHQARAWHW